MDRFLTHRRALIVGGSGGIGAEVSRALARNGASLVVHGGHDREKLEAVAAAAREEGVEVVTLLREIVRAEDGLAILEASVPVDILIVSFGPYLEAGLHQTGVDEWKRLIELNLTLPALLLSCVLRQMRKRGYGRIVVFGGPRGDRLEGYTTIGAYGAAKHGLASLVRSAALQYAADHIRVNMICPGYVATEYYEPQRIAEIARALPDKRAVSTSEVAALVVQLLRPESDAVNGAVIPMDFGFR